MEHNLLPLGEIEKAVVKQGFGTVSLTLEVHESKIVGIQGSQFRKVKFKEAQNAEATALILSEIKDLYEKKQSGTFTFSIEMDKGSIKFVFLNRNLKRNYPLVSESP
jgi:hypothetical protein